MIIEEYDSTVVVPPQWEAAIDTIGNILLTKTNA
jgi:N-methylhydantoinase A/oxoprolinase/acetone carboxylase beta subunit